jgi:cardiolipin synthase
MRRRIGVIGQERYRVDGNEFVLLPDGPDRLSALLDLIGSARRKLGLYYYMFAADVSGTMVRDALIEACRRGVSVTLMIDAFGSSTTPASFLEPLRSAGGRIGRFGAHRSTRYLIRNHQKMAIADGRCAIIGGFNVQDSYFADGSDAKGWCDFGLLIEGSAVEGLQRWFDRLRAWVLKSDQRFRTLRHMVREWVPGDGKLQWLMGGPARLSGWVRRVKVDLEKGSRLDMVEAYFSPGRGMVRRMIRLAERGSARLIVPLYSDNIATISAARHLYGRLLRGGVELFEYQCGKLHMKLVVIDDVVYVGSANFDKRSLFLNVELMLRIQDAPFAEAVRTIITRRESEANPIGMKAWRSMAHPIARLRWLFSYLLVAVVDYTVTRRLNFRREPR